MYVYTEVGPLAFAVRTFSQHWVLLQPWFERLHTSLVEAGGFQGCLAQGPLVTLYFMSTQGGREMSAVIVVCDKVMHTQDT